MKYAIRILVVLVAVSFVFIYSGIYDIAAAHPHTRPVAWLLHKVMERSVKAGAREVKVPDNISKGKSAGSAVFHMCELCHGGPNAERSFIGKGLNPQPPDLREKALEWKEAEIFFIIKNGIKMSGMPSFKPTLNDEQIWNVVAYVKELSISEERRGK